MPILFHQNMRRCGGGVPARNGAYNAAFGGIVAGLAAGVGPVAVAGFTEVTNNGASNAALTASCVALGAVFVGNVACGITALAHGPEYVGIGRNAGYALVTVGRILLESDRRITLIHQRAATTGALNTQALDGSRDYRGLVYVVVASPAGNIAVGFLHNLYTFRDARTLVAAQVGNMVLTMGDAVPGLAAVPVVARYIGGDFNVNMQTPRGGATGYYAAAPAYPAGAAGVGTTYSGSPYDYWYSDVAGAAPAGMIVPVPSASSATLDSGPGAVAAGLAGLMSDHTGTMLQII